MISQKYLCHFKNVKESQLMLFNSSKNRLKLFYNNINKQIKFVLMKGKRCHLKKINIVF